MEPVAAHAETPTADPERHARDVIAVVDALVRDLHPQQAHRTQTSMASRLERDLGIDSLGRTELVRRLERTFGVRLPIALVGEADVVGDLCRALARAGPSGSDLSSVPTLPPAPAIPAATAARTLLEVLEWHVAQHPERLHVTVLEDEATVLAELSYTALAAGARTIASGLVARDVVPGDRVALMLPTSVDFFTVFFGVLLAGAIPVPIYPPLQRAQIESHARSQAGILRNAEARILVTVPEGLRLGALLRGLVESLTAVESAASLSTHASAVALPAVEGSATALIQYTSGSTGEPKGVVLSHANLLANIRAIGRAIDASSADTFVSWLPLYHDMGLIGAWLGCLYFGAPLYIMSPLSFLARPQSWLRAIHRFRGTLTAGPNFAYEHCLNKIDDADIVGIDLSTLRFAANGAEPVSIETMQRFTRRFAPRGFRATAMAPVYGLAENAVAVTLPPLEREPIIDRIDRLALRSRGLAEPATAGTTEVLEVVACGRPIPGHEIRIVDERGQALGERREGRLEFRGPSATSGYFHNPSKTRELFHDGWVDTGDRAYVAAGDLYITGRVKDIIIRAGQHIYPHEIEQAVGRVPALRKDAIAVFGVRDAASGTERIVVLAETDRVGEKARADLHARALDAATHIVGGPPDEVILVAPGTVPKTASGKIRRAAARDLYLQHGLEAAPRAVWWQLARLSIAGLGTRTVRLMRGAGELLYAAWWWTVIAAGFFAGWCAVMALPRLAWRWSAVRMVARAIIALLRAPLSVDGIERIPQGGAVLAFNHASYMDAVVTAAVLPGEPCYVAKKELAEQMFAGPVLRRLGVMFLERFDVAGSLADLDVVTAAAEQGRRLVFFPEGTFTGRRGLSGFYLGAFQVAVQTGLPVVPAVLRGTRAMLRGDQWFPRWSALGASFAPAIAPRGADFSSAVALRDAVRAVILAECGEPDLVEAIKPARSPATSTS